MELFNEKLKYKTKLKSFNESFSKHQSWNIEKVKYKHKAKIHNYKVDLRKKFSFCSFTLYFVMAAMDLRCVFS